MSEQSPIVIGGQLIEPGTRQRVNIALGQLPIDAPIHLPVVVVHGTHPGPIVWISAAIHGDEINGVEIVRCVLERLDPTLMNGTVLAVPIVNVYGFLNESRYLPDRRDLNRCFPGSKKGSLASRLAKLVMTEIVAHCTHGIDLHTGSDHRFNLPQIRGNMHDSETRRLAEAFSPPIIMHVPAEEGTIREAATMRGLPVLLFEGGEPMRFDELSIQVGRDGILRVLESLGMLTFYGPSDPTPPLYAENSTWVRARQAGILRLERKMGERVNKGDVLGAIEDILGERSRNLKAPCDGVIIGQVVNPLVYQGDAVIHIAMTDGSISLEDLELYDEDAHQEPDPVLRPE